jgi:hypothetical protein
VRRSSSKSAVVSLGLFALAGVLGASACGRRAPAVAGVPEVVDFNFHVRPILSDRCFACHGPDDRARKAGLRFDRKEIALGKLPSGHRAIVPGRPGESALVARILSTDPAVMMPDPASRLALDEREKAILVRWIEQGAKWKPHWAFIAPVKAAPPEPKTAGWARSEIDRFVLATLESKGMHPSPEADRATLVRRLTFDLTGLPPTLGEIDAFLADRSKDAYEKLVDRLLASPAYGEHMAAEWLDVARYADSHGYQDDGMREMWPWRDWVISAFNRNLRFDQFITWQLAGDLLDDPTEEQRLATGFNRNHMQSQEGGVVPEEYRTEYVVDRVNTLGRAFLGVSVECARCHDHKYDPVAQKDFYRLFAFFNSVNETGQIPYSGVPSPTVIVTDAAAREKLASIRGRMAALEAETRVDRTEFDRGFDAWLARGARAPVELEPGPRLVVYLPLERGEPGREPVKKEREPPGGEKKKEGDNKEGKPAGTKWKKVLRFANLADPRHPASLGGDEDRVPRTIRGKVGQAQTLVGDSDVGVDTKVAAFERHQPFSLGLWVRLEKEGVAGPLVARSGGIFNGNRGYEILLRKDGTLTAGLHHVFPDNSIEIETVPAIPPGSWHHVALTYDGASRASGLRLFLDGKAAESRVTVDNLHRSILHDGKGKNWESPPSLRLGRRHDETLADVSVDELRVYDGQLTAFEVAELAGEPGALARAIARPRGARSPAERAALREHYVLRVRPGLEEKRRALLVARGEENALLTSLPEVMSLRELPTPRPTFVLTRGAYDAPTERVEPGTPEAILPFPKDLPRNRLGLARWLLDAKHPLTARVIVNRYWSLFFGRGLVATPADFGSQGRLPTHPELLDWLACAFVDSGWDLKALQRRIALSSTYRQSSVADAAALEADPANEWLGRGPAHRLSAEEIRDGALAASGLLVQKIGGPSVYPYQPPGLWEELATRNATSYVPGRGEDLHRRSLYTVWKRSSPPPSAIAFDAAERLTCTVKRQRTSTPLQALVLLNDPQYLEASRALAERMIREGGEDSARRIAYGFRLLTGRAPDDVELALLERLRVDESAAFERDAPSARALLAVGRKGAAPREPAETAALEVVASTMMSFDGSVFRR